MHMQHSPSSSTHRPHKGAGKLDALRIEAVGFSELEVISQLNKTIFEEDRIINTFDRADLLMLVAYLRDTPVGFKIGYKHALHTFYSAKGGVLTKYRRRGIARKLLYVMIERARGMGYQHFMYDTFPNKHPGMAILGFQEGFRLAKADYNAVYKDYRLQFSKDIG